MMNRRKVKCAEPIARPFGTRPVLIADLVKPDEKYTTLEERLIVLIFDNSEGWLSMLSDEDNDKIQEWLETEEPALFWDVFNRFYKDVVEAILEHVNSQK